MTVWFDYTTTLRNQSRNGIANVEWSVGAAVGRSRPDVRFFALQRRHGLRQIDPAQALADVVYARSSEQSVTSVQSRTDRVRGDLVGRLGPEATPIIRVVSSSVQSAKRWRSRVARWLGRVSPAPRPQGRRLGDEVGFGDVVISIGADWSGELVDHLEQLKRETGCHVVLMVYDLIPLTHTHLAFHKDRSLFQRYYQSVLRVADAITCISERTRADLIEFARDPGVAARAHVLRLGDSEPLHCGGVPDGGIPEAADFYLWVGTVERRKNLDLLFDAVRLLVSEQRPVPTIVVAGGIGWGVDDLLAEIELQSHPASRAFVLLGSVDEATLDHLYGRAKALLFPSHYEGWGLPVREAAVRGCPVAAGDSPAVREAAAGFPGATLLPVDDPAPWADYLSREHPRLDPGAVHAWDQTASDLLELAASIQLGLARSGPNEKAL